MSPVLGHFTQRETAVQIFINSTGEIFQNSSFFIASLLILQSEDMACILQPECNFLHGYFRCKLPVEVVDVEVKVMLMQGTHIFRRDQMTQLIRCVLWTTKLHLHPNIVKKIKTFLEVENKMGPIIPALASQFSLPLPETNPNIRKSEATEKRKRVTPKKRFKPATLWSYCDVPALTASPTKTY